MSRIGKMPIPVPAGVDVTIDGQTVTVKGPKGELTRTFLPSMTITRDGDELIVTRPDDTRESKSCLLYTSPYAVYDTDILLIGGGFGASFAMQEACKAGKNMLVIDKAPYGLDVYKRQA